jgi:hypothetical protein
MGRHEMWMQAPEAQDMSPRYNVLAAILAP